MTSRRPFAGEPCAFLVLPESDPTLGGERELLDLERAELDAELGTNVEIVEVDPGEGARWRLVMDETHEGAPRIDADLESKLITSRAADLGGLFESMSLLRTALRGNGVAEALDCADVESAIARVFAEVADTYPSFELRGLDWDEICARHVERVRLADDTLAALQSWLAELQDGHTWVWAPVGNLPYAVRVDDAATFVRVREETRGHAAGVRPGWALIEIDDVPVQPAVWLARAAAPPHSHPLIAGRRLLAGQAGALRTLVARSPAGEQVSWSESPTPLPEGDLVSWRRLDSGAGYLRIAAWAAGHGVDEAIDAAFADLRGSDRLVVDLRGNGGGNLVLAARTRTRFLRGTTALGSVRYTVARDEHSPLYPLVAEPAPAEHRWPGRLVVLTDPLTFSASEDFLLGLRGLEHVTVVGEASGGGSGRARSLRLLPGMTLTVSTALTYDRDGRCVEGAGIPVDVHVGGSDEDVLARAATL